MNFSEFITEQKNTHMTLLCASSGNGKDARATMTWIEQR